MKHPLIKCAVVDDSATQRLAIIKQVRKHPRLELVNEWSNAIEAKNGLLDAQVDLLFLDVEMPILNGFDLLDGLENKPHIIFVTGKIKYAHKAFDYHAIDFLKKPLKKERFSMAIDKVTDAFALKSEVLPQEDDQFVFIKSGIKKYKVYLNHILYVSALKDFAKIHLEDSTFLLVLSTMTSFESLLPSEHFFRTHRSYIVNLNKIDRYSTGFIEINNKNIPISRMKKQKLNEVLNHL